MNVQTADPPRIGALFAGYSGLEMGVQAVLGGTTAWVSEIDPGACKILAHRLPGVPNLGDITAVNWANVEPVDILTGGYPCQPFSHAGRRGGVDDERHLWPHVADAVSHLRPKLCVFENVRGHLSLGFADVMGDLDALGYETTWRVLTASSVGAPHNRARVFILAEDRYGRRIHGWDHRRGGMHSAGILSPGRRDGDRGSDDVLQGAAAPAEDACRLWREVSTHEAGSAADPSGDALLATDRQASGGVPSEGAALLGDQAGAGRPSGLASGEDRRDAARPWTRRPMGTGVEGRGGEGCCADEGTQPDGASAQSPYARCASGDSGGERVGESADDDRPDLGSIHWTVARVGDGGRWSCVLPARTDSAGTEAPHGRFRVFVLAWPAGRPAADAQGDGPGARRQPSLQAQRRSADPLRRSAQSAADADGLGSIRAGGPRRRGTGPADSRGHAPADATCHGWDEGRPEPARLVGGPDAAVGGDAPADASGAGLGEFTGSASAEEARAGAGDELADHRGVRPACDWGPYEPAIRRWERRLGRPAPAPTEPGSKGQPRLSPAFVEWLMGLPAGWVTHVPGLSRNDQLKALGNGVVPQQAAAAVRFMLARLGEEMRWAA